MDAKLPGIQVARALAALSIAYFHSWHVTMPFPPGTAFPVPVLAKHGDLAVPFFFAISGFVICLLGSKPSFRPLSFAIRRAFRLYPVWIATALIYLHMTGWLGRSPAQTQGNFMYSLTLLPTDGFPFYDIGWSLQHEIAFYALAACIVPIFGLRALAAALAIGATADHFLTLPWPLHQYFSYYVDFLAGMAAYAAFTKVRFGVIAPIAGAAAVLYWSPALAPIASFLALLGFLNMRATSAPVRVMAALGDASYSIYLIHPLVFYFIYAHLQEPLPPTWMQEPLRYGAFCAICIISLISWRTFEKAAIYFGNLIARRLDDPHNVVADDRGLHRRERRACASLRCARELANR